jgi:putative transposase
MENMLDLIQEGKIKRYFRVKNKFSFEGAVAHITQHATGKELLFVEELDYFYMLHLIKKMTRKFKLGILSFVLMPSHIHLLTRLGEQSMAQAMKYLFEKYAKFFNQKYRRKGHVFCGPYRYALCLDENYILASSLYIHLNPVRSGLVENPIDYRWSSYALFSGQAEKRTFIDYDFILKLLNSDINKAKEQYKQLICEMIAKVKISVMENDKALEFLRNDLEDILSTKKDIQVCLSGDDIEKRIDLLKESKRLKNPVELKARKFLVEQLMARNYTVSDISHRLKLSRTSIYSILNS